MREDFSGWPAAPAETRLRFKAGLSVFFPAYNDAQSVERLLARTFATLQRVAEDYEVIVVNDGSTDGTAEVLERLRIQYSPWLRIVTHPVNRGYGAALRSGFAAAQKEFVFYTDGDGQYDPAELEKLLGAVTPDTALVNGYKMERHDPWHRIVIGKTYNQVARAIFGIRLRDIDCDFRVIRRSSLEHAHLQSTGGTICIELVRSLEATGEEVVELPVHHYPRLHGRSQFFRVRSLLTTFLQLCAIYLRLVLLPLLTGTRRGQTARLPAAAPPGAGTVAAVLCAIVALSFLAYYKAMEIPFISDSYLQLQLARDFGSVSAWAGLAQDVLYRYRATSLILTYWIDRTVGSTPLIFHVAGIILHILCGFLVYALGSWRPIGWRLAAVAACFFAVSQRHSEAVIWHAASPELLVFLFSVSSFLCWVHWLQETRYRATAYAGALGLFVVALLSKESAVAMVPLCGLAALLRGAEVRRRLVALLPFAFLAVVYFLLAFLARDRHQHFGDGTFSLSAPFAAVLVRSVASLLWVWGLAALVFLFAVRQRHWFPAVRVSLAWMAITLLPYCFLEYMPRVPSRHTYFASAGLALLVGAGLMALKEQASRRGYAWVAPLLGLVIVAEQASYLWTYKHRQYALRAEPTEILVRKARESQGPIYASCFPYSVVVAEYALKVSVPEREVPFLLVGDTSSEGDTINLCNSVAHEATQ